MYHNSSLEIGLYNYFEKRNNLFSTILYKVNENSARENNKDWQTKAQGSNLFI